MNTIAGSENVVVRTYRTEHDMQRGIKSMAKGDWNVLNVQRTGQGYAAGKTCCLGALFLPLALFGKKGDVFTVTYRKDKTP